MTSNKGPEVQDTMPDQALAIVGIGCVFPKAKNATEFWNNIREGVDAIGDIPASHWRPEDYYHQEQATPDMTYARRGGFIDPVDFDPLMYGMSPNNIEATDTTQLLGMVVAREALLDAGYSTGKEAGDGREFDRDRTSVILGVTGTLELVIPLGARLGHPLWRKALSEAGVDQETADDVVQRISDGYVPWQENSFPGLLGNVAAGRIANRFDLGGTNCVVDAACASSLSAIHMAALELSSGRVDMAIAGGMDTFNDIFMYMCFSKTPALSPTGNSRPFARDGDGTILGEGLGAVVLKRLSDAQRDGDRIHAVIRGIGTSSDGRGNAIYAPSSAGQSKALRDAYTQAQVTPSSIELIEAHGTGTSVGDAVEAKALVDLYREDRAEGSWCAIGSVKSMIGHTKAAAGVAGLIKAALALEHKVLPPTIKVDQPLEQLAPGQAPVYINTEKRPWVASPNHPRRAAISAFGFGGSNFHCVLEESSTESAEIDWDGRVQILALSADDRSQLISQLKNLDDEGDWDELRAVAARSRVAFDPDQSQRLVMVLEQAGGSLAKQRQSAISKLSEDSTEAYWQIPGGVFYAQGSTTAKTALLFPGQGSQYVGMLRDLACQFPSITESLAAANLSGKESDTGERLSDLIYPIPVFEEKARQEQEDSLRDTRHAQPAIGAVSLAALQVLQDFGLSADYAVGHSYGELVALCAAGRIGSDELHSLSRLRGELMATGEGDRGSMLAVSASIEQVEGLLNNLGLDLVVANHNAPEQVVVSGATEAVEKLLELAKQQGLRASRLPVSAAFHSHFIADAAGPFAEALEAIDFAPGTLPVLANTSADLYPEKPSEARTLLAEQLANPVQFVAEIEKLLVLGVRHLVEIGPGNRLAGLARSITAGHECQVFSLDASSGKRSGQYDLACLLAPLAVLGQGIDLKRWDQDYLPRLEARPERKAALTIPLSGANYMKPRTARPPRQPASPGQASVQKERSAETKVIKQQTNTTSPGNSVKQTRSAAQSTQSQTGNQSLLNATQQSILALQKMQEQTANLHKQYLQGQETAQQTIHQLLLQQQSLLQGLPFETDTDPVLPQASVPTAEQPAAAVILKEPPMPAEPVRAAQPVTETPAEISEVIKSASSESINSNLLEVVAEKTGYPLEMLSLDMSLDTDLGIDSIKRVEILSALQERLPWAPTVDPEELSTFRFLHHIVEYLLAGAEAQGAVSTERPVAASTAESSGLQTELHTALLEVVAEKTGYPVEMLDLGMSMDADLGIDSIKRVEILSALQERLPNLPAVSPDDLGRLQTLQEIIDYMGNSQPAVSTDTAAVIPKQASGELHTALLEVVAEKTGYPVEMLDLGMSMDADLGIDSIKRVEILSALQERLPDLPAVSPDDLGRLQTLQEIIDYMGSSLPAVSANLAATALPALATEELHTALLEVVAEKTGYPVEMLDLGMSMDADLGIDSIKRVEILSALQERLPDLPAVSPDDLGRLQTLQEIIDYMGRQMPDTEAEVTGVVSTISLDTIAEAMLSVVAEKTGYPVEMLELPMNLEADLGIDSIKRVEILSALQERMPELPAVKPEELGQLQTLQQIIDYMATTGEAETDSLATPDKLDLDKPAVAVADQSVLLRSVIQPVQLNAGEQPALPVAENAVIWVCGETAQDCQAVCEALKLRGLVPEIVPLDSQPDEAVAGLILLSPETVDDQFVSASLQLIQRLAASLHQSAKQSAALLASVTRFGGLFGLDANTVSDPLGAALHGLIKTADKEWPEVSCRSIDMEIGEISLSQAQLLIDECLQTGPLEVGLKQGERYHLKLEQQDLSETGEAAAGNLEAGDLVVISGGARGVTAEVAVRLAERKAVNLLLLGRSAMPEQEADWLASLQSDAEIKRGLMEHSDAGTKPATLQKKFQQVMANREILRNLKRIADCGVQVEYQAVDVRDGAALEAVLDRAREQFGPVRGLIHAAGVLADRLIEDKTQEQFAQVFSTKVDGAQALLKATAEDPLSVLVMFSSTTARLGRKGQCDYAAANEVLNKLAQQQAATRNACRVLSINWGPWDGGMVTPALKQVFAEEGVGVIPLRAGADYLIQEMSQAGPVEVVILGATASQQAAQQPTQAPEISQHKLTTAFERQLSIETFPFLKSHVMNGQAVLPVALMVEWFAHGAMHGNPGMSYLGFDDLRVYKGVTLSGSDLVELQIQAGQAHYQDGLAYVPLEIRSGEVLHARSRVVLGNERPAAIRPGLQRVASKYRLVDGEYYRNGQLFHGADLQAIDTVLACADDGIVAKVSSAPAPASWINKPVRSRWSSDPLVLDASFQMMILWSFAEQGIPSLPTAIGQYRQYAPFPDRGVEVVVQLLASTAHRATARIEFIDAEGDLIAAIQDYECVRDASLIRAFKRNQLESYSAEAS